MVSELESNQDALSEIIKQPSIVTHVFSTSEVTTPRLHVNQVIDIDSFNSLMKLPHVTATVIRIVNKLMDNLKDQEQNSYRTVVDSLSTAY